MNILAEKKRGNPNMIHFIFLSPSPSGMPKVLEEGWGKDDQNLSALSPGKCC